MFRTLIYPSSGACDYSVELPHWSYCSWLQAVSVLQASACNTDTTPTQPHRNSKTHRTKNNTTNVVIQQNSRKPLMMDILMSETCWAHKKWNKEQVTSSWSFILQIFEMDIWHYLHILKNLLLVHKCQPIHETRRCNYQRLVGVEFVRGQPLIRDVLWRNFIYNYRSSLTRNCVYRQVKEQFEMWNGEGRNWETRKGEFSETLQHEITQIELKQTITSRDCGLLQSLWVS